MDNKPQILVVEDDIAWQENYREALESRDYEVQVVGDKESALNLLNRRFFHAAVIDLKLSEDANNRDGLDILRRIWSLDEGTRAVVGSGYVDVSMFDEFQRMGIFSLTEIPTEARKQIRLIEFFKGVIKKDDPLQKILDTVDRAVDESWRKYTKQQWSQSPFKIVKDIPAQQIQRLLSIGKIEELRPFLSSLVRPLYPWLHTKANSMEVKNKDGVIALESICWSRALGHAVVIRFGKRDKFEESIERVGIAAPYGGVVGDKIYEKPTDLDNPQPFRGAVYMLDIDFDDHFDLPTIKKQAVL